MPDPTAPTPATPAALKPAEPKRARKLRLKAPMDDQSALKAIQDGRVSILKIDYPFDGGDTMADADAQRLAALGYRRTATEHVEPKRGIGWGIVRAVIAVLELGLLLTGRFVWYWDFGRGRVTATFEAASPDHQPVTAGATA